MSSRIDYALNGWWDDNQDPALAAYIPGGPGWLFAIVAAYLLFVLKVGPQFMRERKAYDLPTTLKVYNLLNIVANVVLFVIGLRATNFGIAAFTCSKDVPFFYRYSLSFGYLYLKVGMLSPRSHNAYLTCSCATRRSSICWTQCFSCCARSSAKLPRSTCVITL